MVQESSFILDKDGEYMCLDTARIIVGENLPTLLAIMNSKLFFYAVKAFYGGGGLGEAGIRMKHTFFEKFPMPEFISSDHDKIRTFVKSPTEMNLTSIDKIIYKAFELEKDEVDFIESQ